MRVRIIAFVILSILGGSVASAAARLDITYVANEGFLLASGSKKVLIDALFDDESITYCHVPNAELRELSEGAQPPFDEIDLILVTHNHRDHFSSKAVLRRMAAEPRSHFVGPPQAVAELMAGAPQDVRLANRVHEVDLELFTSTRLEIAGIRLWAIRLRHSEYMVEDRETGQQRDKHAEVENLAYLIEMKGQRIFHVGDAVLSENSDYFDRGDFPKGKLDVVFLEYFDRNAETLKILYGTMDPEHVVFMHLPRKTDQIEQVAKYMPRFVPQAVVFAEPMEKKTF